MSLAQGFPSTFSDTQKTNEVLHNLDNETKKIYNDVNAIMAADGHSHTGNGSDGALLSVLGLEGGTLTGVLNEALGAPIASASTINLTTATGNFLHVTGTTTITAVTLGAGMRREVIFDGILTLTHHATNNNLPGGANITTAVGDRASYYSDGTTVYCTKYVKADGTAVVAPTTKTTTTIRQTVLSGAVDSNGQANQLQIGTGLAVNELATTVPTVTTWANGFDSNGSIDYIQMLSTTVSSAWSSLTANSTLYLYKERNATTGAVTYGFTTLIPLYQSYTPTTPTIGQYWFDTINMVGQYYSGSAWVLIQRVFVGECVTGASTVTTVISYAYNGEYKSANQTLVLANTDLIVNHYLGLKPLIATLTIRCTTAELGYVVGDEVTGVVTQPAGGALVPMSPFYDYKKMGIHTANTNPWVVLSRSTGTNIPVTLGSWKAIFHANRGW